MSDEKKQHPPVDLAQTIVMRSEPLPRPDTSNTQTQVWSLDIERKTLVQNQPNSQEGKTMILWASETSSALATRPPLTTALAKTQEFARPRQQRPLPARTVKDSFLETLVHKHKRTQLKAAPRPQMLRAAIAIAAVAIGCSVVWQYTTPSEPPQQHVVKPRANPAIPPRATAPTAVIPSTPGTAPAEPTNATERSAVDALHAGDYTRAAQQYQALARAYPERREFREALHILQRSQQGQHL